MLVAGHVTSPPPRFTPRSIAIFAVLHRAHLSLALPLRRCYSSVLSLSLFVDGQGASEFVPTDMQPANECSSPPRGASATSQLYIAPQTVSLRRVGSYPRVSRRAVTGG